MSTNYYIQFENNPFEELFNCIIHFGKSSCGWHFTLHVYPEKNINNFEDWLNVINKHPNKIKDEYNAIISFEELVDVICNRSGEESIPDVIDMTMFLGKHISKEEYLVMNHAKIGKNNLLQHIGENCIGTHDKFPIDYIIGEFF